MIDKGGLDAAVRIIIEKACARKESIKAKDVQKRIITAVVSIKDVQKSVDRLKCGGKISVGADGTLAIAG